MRSSIVIASIIAGAVGQVFADSVASSVVNYQAGTTTDVNGNPIPLTDGYQNASAALGLPSGDTSYGALTPFNPDFLSDDIVELGNNGSITLKFDQSVAINASAKLGVFDNTGIADESPSTFDSSGYYITGGTGQAGTPPFTFGGGAGYVSVSADGTHWYTKEGNAWVSSDSATPDLVNFSMPTNGFTDNDINLGKGSIGKAASDYFKPFTGSIDDFSGLAYRDPTASSDILRLLDGSAGGTWLDLSTVPLADINYVKFDSPSDSRIILDAVTAVPEPVSIALLSLGSLLLRRRRAV